MVRTNGSLDARAKQRIAVKAAATLLGIGSCSTASAVVATVAETFKQFKNGAQFGSTGSALKRLASARAGGKNNLGGITKRGDTYLRTLLIQSWGEVVSVMTAHLDDRTRSPHGWWRSRER